MTPGPSETERQSLLHALGARVLAAIAQERHYPRQALRRRVEGTVTLEVTIDRSGGLMNLSVRRSSGQRILDDAASNAARAVHRFPQAPDELPGGPFTFAIPVRFAIR
ncbi:MAG: energy transducer TonB [Pseudomonadota bacterium]